MGCGVVHARMWRCPCGDVVEGSSYRQSMARDSDERRARRGLEAELCVAGTGIQDWEWR
jgi:hypothetical protein